MYAYSGSIWCHSIESLNVVYNGTRIFQGLLFTDDTDLTLDVTLLTNEDGGQDFVKMFKENVLARAKTDEKYKKLILGLAQEGHQKGLY